MVSKSNYKNKVDGMVIEEYLFVTCLFIGRRVVSPASCKFIKTRFCDAFFAAIYSVTKEP